MPTYHHTLTAAQLRTGHLLYTGGSGNYVAVAAATPNTQGKIQVWIYDGDNAIAEGVRYTLEPESLVSISARVPLAAGLTASQWETIIEALDEKSWVLADEDDSSCCPPGQPMCGDHRADQARVDAAGDLAKAIRAQIGVAEPGGPPGRSAH